MRPAADRPDPGSPFGMRPLFAFLLGTVAVAICGSLFFVLFWKSPQTYRLPVDDRGRVASFGAVMLDYRSVPIRKGPDGRTMYQNEYNKNQPCCLIVAGWDDGRIAWGAGKDWQDAELAQARVDPQLISSARALIAQRMGDASRFDAWKSGSCGGVEYVCFVSDGERFQIMQSEHEVVIPANAGGYRSDDPLLAEFRETWAECIALAQSIIPPGADRQAAEWVRFEKVTQ